MDKSRKEWRTDEAELSLYGEFGYSIGDVSMDDGLYGKLKGLLERRIEDGRAVEGIRGRLSRFTETEVSQDLSMGLLSDLVGELFSHGGRLEDLRITPSYSFRRRRGTVHVELEVSVEDGSVEVDWKDDDEDEGDE